ncbi:hypothetical protein GYMLUDRAFT_159648 [Collybiopsis luxurians FD-317 M1]|nr:hypothetical protein GYMLUDRAFT_159648 [Collybiopsis luxurians FD-317 M1]
MSAAPNVTEGFIPFTSPSLPADKPSQTFYKIVGGPLSKDTTPLIALHGGPGAGHDYLLVLADGLGAPLIVYDQVGCGQSTHYPEKKGDTSFWTVQLFLSQLDHLIRHFGLHETGYFLGGHSWGGMLAAEHAILQPKGLKRLILMSSPADMGLWVKAQSKLKKLLPQQVQDTIEKNEREGTTESKEYKEVMEVFYKQFLCRLDPVPELVLRGLVELEKDDTVYLTMQTEYHVQLSQHRNGPSEFHITGSLATWSVVKEVHKINVPTLITNGRYDEAQDETVLPFFNEIPRVKWVRFENSSHMPHFEEQERYMEVIKVFLGL